MDTLEVQVLNRTLKLLNIVDEATAFQVIAPLWSGATSANTRTCFRKYWKRWAGSPNRVLVDNGHEFEGVFKQGLEADGAFCDTTAAFAPYQNGMCERRGGTWKRAFVKAVDSLDPKDRAEVDEIIDQVNVAVNTLPRLDGHSPDQQVFGKESKFLTGLELDVPLTVETLALSVGESIYEKRQKIRMHDMRLNWRTG